MCDSTESSLFCSNSLAVSTFRTPQSAFPQAVIIVIFPSFPQRQMSAVGLRGLILLYPSLTARGVTTSEAVNLSADAGCLDSAGLRARLS